MQVDQNVTHSDRVLADFYPYVCTEEIQEDAISRHEAKQLAFDGWVRLRDIKLYCARFICLELNKVPNNVFKRKPPSVPVFRFFERKSIKFAIDSIRDGIVKKFLISKYKKRLNRRIWQLNENCRFRHSIHFSCDQVKLLQMLKDFECATGVKEIIPKG